MENVNSSKYSGLAITSLVLGLVSLFPLFGFPAAILAIVFGIVSQKHIKNGFAQGKGLAVAGLILGIVSSVISLLIIASMVLLYFPA